MSRYVCLDKNCYQIILNILFFIFYIRNTTVLDDVLHFLKNVLAPDDGRQADTCSALVRQNFH
jgi:hypothetical protein